MSLAARKPAIRPPRPRRRPGRSRDRGYAGLDSRPVGRNGGGLELLRSAAAGAPSNQDVQYHLAYALNSTGARDEAREILEKLVAEDKPFQTREAAAELLGTIKR